MFGFGRRAGVTDRETWTLVIRVAVKMTAEEQVSKHAVGIEKAREILDAECKYLGLRPTKAQQKYIEAAIHGLSSSTLALSLMDRWLKDERVTITQVDIANAAQILEGAVKEFLNDYRK
jgi:hypothetical protein